MKVANINTGEIKDGLSPILVLTGKTITGATIADWAALGWREVVATDVPAAGYRVASYGVQELTSLTCKLTVASSVDIAAEQAANLAAEIASDKAAAKLLSDVATSDVGRVIRAFAELTLQEINTLRTKASLANYTQTQFINALKAKIDAQA
jgi:hypothetical protein